MKLFNMVGLASHSAGVLLLSIGLQVREDQIIVLNS